MYLANNISLGRACHMKLETIKSKIVAAGICSLILSGISALLGLYVSIEYSKGVERAVNSASVMRNVMFGDMMHDTLRADAMNSLLSSNPATRMFEPTQVINDINEHVTGFQSAINEAKQKTHSPEVREALTKLDVPLAEYFKSAQDIGGSIVHGEAPTKALIPAFQSKFEQLEEAMGAASEVVENAAKNDAEGAANQAKIFQILMTATLIFAITFAVLMIILANKQIVKPINEVTIALEGLANGNLQIVAPDSRIGGEIGKLESALATFKENALEQKRLEQREAMSTEERIVRGRKIEDITNKFASILAESLTTLSSTSQELQANACQLGAMASQTESLTKEASLASEHASDGVNSIASATTELTANVEQISQQMQRSAAIASTANTTSRSTEESVNALADAVSEISEVVSLIDEVAAQTNLLALNATIEAARAGEAGKGFAVVASEVKGLAAQTATATQDISRRIHRIREASQYVAQSVSQIINMVEEMYSLAISSSDAVLEQTSATAMIAESATMASRGTAEANEHVLVLSNSAQDATEASHALSEAAQEVARRAAQLRQDADEFFAEVKAA